MNSNLDLKIKKFERNRNLILGILLGIFILISVVLNNLHFTQLAIETTRLLNRYIEIGDQREVSYILNQSHTNNFELIRFISKNTSRTFTIPPKAEIYDKPSIFTSLYQDRIATPVSSGVGTEEDESIIYEFNRFKFVPFATLVWILILLISIPQTNYMKKQLLVKFNDELELQRKNTQLVLSNEVRHNLRTPLAALMRIPSRLKGTDKEEKDLLKGIIYQIQEIINKLDHSKIKGTAGDISSINFYDILKQSKNEIELTIPQKIQFAFRIDESLFSALGQFPLFELRSIISNIVNNSIEAIQDFGKISVKAKDQLNYLEITFTDSGLGMSQEVLQNAFERNFSFNKANGTGIGLSHAKEQIEKWQGSIKLKSTSGFGTTCEIKIPIHSRKAWYLPRIKITTESKIYILDDQQLNHDLWKIKFKNLNLENEVIMFRTLSDVENWISQNHIVKSEDIFLFDYDLNSSITGLDILLKIPGFATRCLVTGHFDDQEVQERCLEAGVFIIPKSGIQNLDTLLINSP